MKSKGFIALFSTLVILSLSALPVFAGEVYLVLGSDTAIWQGMNTNRYNCTYNDALYTDPSSQTFTVMDPLWREQFLDSYGTPMKMTWWMMAGNIFRYATNRNVPLPNIMTLYLMKSYHGEGVKNTGDELSLHYHTFVWTDYNQDGIYYWNQALDFSESRDDFDVTLAQFLLEEETFPVSFRSGWHYMDNTWQNYLDELVPYSMHNDWPSNRVDTTEPLDNTFNWSEAPSDFVPYHPSLQNYQIPGDGKSYNVRSEHIGSVTQNLMNEIFNAANDGTVQVPCLWGHLPESDFLDNLAKIHNMAVNAAETYADVTFRYCTAIEAMQRWLGTEDNTPPELAFSLNEEANGYRIHLETDEPIFQKLPFVAVKDIYNDYMIVPMQNTGENSWQSTEIIDKELSAKAGVALTDTVGNQSIKTIALLPDDQFLDNTSDFQGGYGAWQTAEQNRWRENSVKAMIQPGDSVTGHWSAEIDQATYYNLFSQHPLASDMVDSVHYTVELGGVLLDTLISTANLKDHVWNYIGTIEFHATGLCRIHLTAKNTSGTENVLFQDALKLTPLVPKRELWSPVNMIDLQTASVMDTVISEITLYNRGIEPLSIDNIYFKEGVFNIPNQIPGEIESMGSVNLSLSVYSETEGNLSDTLIIESNDPKHPLMQMSVQVEYLPYHLVIDNDESAHYSEKGDWATSVAQAYGTSSRYAFMNNNDHPHATFSATLEKSGIYEIWEIVPKTVNSAHLAWYKIGINDVYIDSVQIDQNEGSGSWVSLGEFYLPAGIPVQVRVEHHNDPEEGDVLRADAIQFMILQEITDVSAGPAPHQPGEFELAQNYPNPFNPTTTIAVKMSKAGKLKVHIYDVSGQLISSVYDGEANKGWHHFKWDGRNRSGAEASSGVYIYRAASGDFSVSKKMVKLK